MTTFGSLIRSYRLRAGLGLRTFAALIDERASVVSAIESDRRAPWRREATLHRVAEVLGLAESSNLWQKILDLAQKGQPANLGESVFSGRLTWWWQSEDAPALDAPSIAELASFVGATTDLNQQEEDSRAEASHSTLDEPLPSLTELAIEWRVRKLLGRRETQLSTAPVDVEAALESEARARLEIVPGLIPRFSVQACAVRTPDGLTFFVDRIIADSRPMASYRELLALCYAPTTLWEAERIEGASLFSQLRNSDAWAQCLRDCERFALAMMLPANPVLAGAETAYSELVQQHDTQLQGCIEVDDAARALRNRLAEQFAVPTSLVHRRLVGWPCHVYGRVAQAIVAQEMTLPPLDWLVEEEVPQQRLLFT